MKVSSALRKALVLLRSMLTTVRNNGLAVLLIGAILVSSVWAHGILMESSPKQNAILHHYPDKVVLRFNASLAGTGSESSGPSQEAPRSSQSFSAGTGAG